jgi:hypothetical protein
MPQIPGVVSGGFHANPVQVGDNARAYSFGMVADCGLIIHIPMAEFDMAQFPPTVLNRVGYYFRTEFLSGIPNMVKHRLDRMGNNGLGVVEEVDQAIFMVAEENLGGLQFLQKVHPGS